MKQLRVIGGGVALLAMTAALVVTLMLTEAGMLPEQWMNLAQFIGRFHPVILHLPIGLFLGLTVLYAVARIRNDSGLKLAAEIVLWLTASSAVLAAVLGLFLAANGDYTGDTIWWHKWLAILFTVGLLAMAGCSILKEFILKPMAELAYRLLLFAMLLLLPVVGHLGGNLTHGSDYLLAYAPAWVQGLLSEPEGMVLDVPSDESSEENLYLVTVQPFLEQYCIQCHGPEKQKSGYRMDTYEALMTPGKMGDTPVVPNQVSQSILLEYLWLPEEDDMAMPPEGKPRPSAEEILAITHWVAMGAPGPPIDEAALQAQKEEQEQLNRLIDRGIFILPESQNSEWLVLDFQNVKGEITSEDWAMLAPFKDRIVELKCTATSITPGDLAVLQGASQLKQVNFSGLQSADALVEVMNAWPALERLNLFGSDLTDQGLAQLKALSSGSLYVGSTQVSPQKLAAFREQFANVEVYGDVDLNEIQQLEAVSHSNTSDFIPEPKKK